ncbi:MAG: FAD-dependent oxidoreductase [Betaproteobacteria bacterium]|nr:FAD-dependent oxidoreductase [Betaproteobacteria bacterium]MSQ89486.1 FAD-dependent oxidoreductase [Betaproteobacteria bacterium]
MAVLPAEEGKFEYSVPVLVIGAGACGLTAALAAKESGAQVLVLERDAKPTGSTALSTGLIPAAGTRFQKALGIEDAPELLAGDIWRKAKGQTDRAIVDAVAVASGPTIEWLADRHGVAFKLVEGFLYPGHSVLRMHGTPHRTGEELESTLLAAAGRLEIDIMTGATATDLYARSDGRVSAVRFARPDGRTETIGCDALVLACCGFGGDKEMVGREIPEIADAEFWGHAGNKGDAVTWGQALGAAVADMGSYQGHGAVAVPYGNPVNWGVLMNGGYQVNSLGLRFSNEVRGYSEQAVEVIAQPGRVAWDIYDEARERPILGFADYEAIRALGGIRKAASLRELAALMGMSADALECTNTEVDSFRADEKQDRWGRSFSGTQPLAAPFCAVKVTGALFHTQGGLVIDTAARVLRTDRTPLPNLFAGGGAARGLSGPSNWGYFSGGGLLTATTLGRIAGTSAGRLSTRSY